MVDHVSNGDAAARRRFTDIQGGCSTVIGPDVTIKGEVRGETNMELRGTLEGILDIDGYLWLRADGRVDGDIAATDVVIEGAVHGNLRIAGKAELRSSCRVTGDIVARAVAIAEGGFFEGSITMDGQSRERVAVSFPERRTGAGA